MAIADSVTRLSSTLLSIVHTRLELAVTEIEEESLRLVSYLLLALAAMFCVSLTLLLAVFLVIAIYWDTHRIGAIVTLMVIFGAASAIILLGVRSSFKKKPKLMAHTINEFKRDYERLHASK